VAEASFKRYETVIERFLTVMGPGAAMDLADLGAGDILQFRDAETARVSATTVNQGLKVLRMILKAAQEDGLTHQNVALSVRPVKASGAMGRRREFTLAELNAVLRVCNDEWRSLVHFGFYTGARLSDIAALTWANVDLESGELRFVDRKTARTMITPIARQLREQILQLPAGDTPDEPLNPGAFGILKRQRRSGTLSRQFSEILAAAGLRDALSHRATKKGAGGDSRRRVNELSFHSLRHTAVSLLKKAGVGEAIAMDLVGHESVSVSRHYTHIDFKTKADAINQLPGLGGG
jgi:integrase